VSELSSWAKARGISMYSAIKQVGLASDEATPFNNRTTKLLGQFAQMAADLAAKSHELTILDLFDQVLKQTGYQEFLLAQPEGEERWENVLELRGVVQQYNEVPREDALNSLLEGVALVSDVDGLEQSVDAVTLITLHQAKGLEFPVVFIVGMEEGILPHIRSLDDPAQLEEERRLCYVGITRAQRRIYLVRAFRRTLMGGSTANTPSRFLKDIPRSLTAGADLWQGKEGQAAQKAYEWEESQDTSQVVSDLKSGDRVRHAQFGEGVVISAHLVRRDVEMVVAFKGVGTKKLLLSFAKLEKIPSST
jgi:DNA helicase-2/ATP-dependent DNA helicase PcrA